MPNAMRGLLFGNDGALIVLPRPTTIPVNEPTNNGGWRTTHTGLSYIDYTNTPTATHPRIGGIALSHDGAVFCTTDAVGASTCRIGGLAISATGQLHITFTRPTTPVWNGGFCTSSTGVVYVAGMIESPAAAFMYGLGITQAGGFVSQWNDQSGNARHLKQVTATNQPSLQSDKSILFDGVDNDLQTDNFTWNLPATAYILFRQITWVSADFISNGNTGAFFLQQFPTTPIVRLSDGVTDVAEPGQLAVGAYGVITYQADGANGGLIQVNKNTAVTGALAGENPGGFVVGSAGGATLPANIQVKEIILYAAAHNTAQITRVVNYLSAVGDLGL